MLSEGEYLALDAQSDFEACRIEGLAADETLSGARRGPLPWMWRATWRIRA